MPATKPSSRFDHLPRAASGALKCALEGQQLLAVAQYNKGSAFPNDERKEFGLYGLLPPKIQTLEEQVDRAYQQYSSRGDDLAKNTFMASMKAQNEVLYYKVRKTPALASTGVCSELTDRASYLKHTSRKCSASSTPQQKETPYRTILDFFESLRGVFSIFEIRIRLTDAWLPTAVLKILITSWSAMAKRYCNMRNKYHQQAN